jgi:predicted deacylase
VNDENTDPAELIERLRRQVNALAEYAANVEASPDEPLIGVTQATAALARDALTQLCEVSSPGKFSTWVDDRIAAEHIAAALCTARGPRGKGVAAAWLDQHTARRGYDTLKYFTAHDLVDDLDAAKRAGLELADLLELGDEVRGPFLASADAPKYNVPRKVTKRPVTVEAMHFAGTTADMHAVYQWVEANTDGSFEPYTNPPPASGVSINPETGEMMIATLEGIMHVSLGDWVIRGVKGEFYPCKPDVFEATYDA